MPALTARSAQYAITALIVNGAGINAPAKHLRHHNHINTGPLYTGGGLLCTRQPDNHTTNKPASTPPLKTKLVCDIDYSSLLLCSST